MLLMKSKLRSISLFKTTTVLSAAFVVSLAASLIATAGITIAQAEETATAKKDQHVSSCDKNKAESINKSRCERHEKIAEKCGPLKGDAHFACDREYLLANPLLCKTMNGKDGDSCKAEVAAFKSCEANQGREFMKCVYKATGESPMGH